MWPIPKKWEEGKAEEEEYILNIYLVVILFSDPQ